MFSNRKKSLANPKPEKQLKILLILLIKILIILSGINEKLIAHFQLRMHMRHFRMIYKFVNHRIWYKNIFGLKQHLKKTINNLKKTININTILLCI